jgi:hypothetical protein
VSAPAVVALVVWAVAMCAAAVMCFWCAGRPERRRAREWSELLPERRYQGAKIVVDKQTQPE